MVVGVSVSALWLSWSVCFGGVGGDVVSGCCALEGNVGGLPSGNAVAVCRPPWFGALVVCG